MAYEIILTTRAKRDLQSILDDDSGYYSPAQRLAYVQAIRRVCRSLDPWPKRSTPLEINGIEYRRIFYKSHTIFFRVFDDDNTVLIDAVLHSHMDFGARL